MTSFKFSKNLLLVYLVLSFVSVNLVTFHLAFQKFHDVMIAINFPIELLYILKVNATKTQVRVNFSKFKIERFLCLLQIYLAFNTGFYDEAGDFVTDLKRIKAK